MKLVFKILHTEPQGPRTFLVRYKFWLGAYAEFQPVGWSG